MAINIQVVDRPATHTTERRANNLRLELDSLQTANGATIDSLTLLNEVLRSADSLARQVKEDFAKPLAGTALGVQLGIMRGHRAGIRSQIAIGRETRAKSRAIVAESKRLFAERKATRGW